MNRSYALAFAATTLLVSLGGCSKQSDDPVGTAAAEGEAQSLTAGLDDLGGMSKISGGLTATGLAGIFENRGSYTIIAPTDAAFAKLGDAGGALMQPDNRAALAALVREHIVPGALTTQDIAKAIDVSSDKSVKMRTMGSGDLIFRKAGSAIEVTSSDGSTALLNNATVRAKGSVAITADSVLKKI